MISLGSNIEPERNICLGVSELARRMSLAGVSRAVWTHPVGSGGQPRYINCVVFGYSPLPPLRLKYSVLRKIEQMAGRKRVPDRFAPRTLDLDILLYGDRVYRGRRLAIPDPDIYTRPFLPSLMHELDRTLIMPDSGMEISELLTAEVFPENRKLSMKLRQLIHSV